MADITNRADWIVFSNKGATQDTHHATSCASATDVSEVSPRAASRINVTLGFLLPKLRTALPTLNRAS